MQIYSIVIFVNTLADMQVLRGLFIKFPDWGCNFSKYQVILLKLYNNMYIYTSDFSLIFHSFIFYSFIFMHINLM